MGEDYSETEERRIELLLDRIANLEAALKPIKWLVDLHEQSRHGRDDPDTTSVMVALGVLRRARDAASAQTSSEEPALAGDTASHLAKTGA